MNKPFGLLIALFFGHTLLAQDIQFEKVSLSDSITIGHQMQNLAQELLSNADAGKINIVDKDLFRIEILAEDYNSSLERIESLRDENANPERHPRFISYELYSRAKLNQKNSGANFQEAYTAIFDTYIQSCSYTQAFDAPFTFTTFDRVARYAKQFKDNYEKLKAVPLSNEQCLNLLKDYFIYQVFTQTEPIVFVVLKMDEERRYIVEDDLLITTKDGAEIAAVTARRRTGQPLPTILYYTIYADVSNRTDALLAASKGYVGVFATTRGKGLSKSKLEPYEHENKDVYATIDWISQQPWCNGQVGMYGGSYGGFAQWASMKEQVHPSLKTVVASVSIVPGYDVPMENNVFQNFPYSWIPYVSNNEYLDNATYFDQDRWDSLQNNWFNSGSPYNRLDSIDGTDRPLFQKWISHPSYDEYWQSMVPYKEEFAHIDIPILTTTGFYDDAQRGALYYYREHMKYNQGSEHYLLIGPYDHWGAQMRSSRDLRGYQIDEVASINIKHDLVFEWFDYILKAEEKPRILKDKVNFQVMGTNRWMHKPSLAEMSNDSLIYFFKTNDDASNHQLVEQRPLDKSTLILEIDLKDRTTMNNPDYYPWPIVKDSINLSDGLVFFGQPLTASTIINGSYLCHLVMASNKKDFDYSVNLYELTEEGQYFQLSFYIGRASYSMNREQRVLLKPNKDVYLSFNNTQISSKLLAKGSRIVVVVNGNKNPNTQINYGTGKDVSKESIGDANTPLRLTLKSGSRIVLPIWNEK
jgi:putative CocE/NonD family hydrolase